jgi:hypothetical protein
VPADVGPGDSVLVFLEKESNASITSLAAGFVELGTAAVTTTNVMQHHVFSHKASSAESGTYDFSWSGTAPYAEAVAIRFPGAASSPIGTGTEAPQAAQRSSSAAATPNVALTTTGVDRLLVWSGANWNGGAWTPPTGWDEAYDGGTTLTVAVLAKPTAGATGNVAGTCSASDYSTARLLALVPGTSARRGIPIGVFL